VPTLIVVSGPPGSGKTTLAHKVAGAIGCPAICRDEIKEGMVHATPGFVPGPSDPQTMRTFDTFFDVLRLLMSRGTTVVAEAAFQDRLWRPRLEPFADLASLRIVRCAVDADLARARITRRANENPLRKAHEDGHQLADVEGRRRSHESFVPISMPVPTIDVDTTDGYDPGLLEIVAFVNSVH
jgi:predicted kinase